MARKSRKQGVPEIPYAVLRVWKTAFYLRLSVDGRGMRGDSLETQQQILEGYLALRPELKLVQIFTDNGATGRNFDRPAFQAMMDDIDAGKIDCVMVKDLSRLGRNSIDTGYYVEKYFPRKGVRFISVNDEYDSEAPSTSGEHIILPLKNMVKNKRY